MADSQLTKQALAVSVKELMNTMPLSKISVGDIAAHCGVNRQTFYYHFKDKYELVNWIYYSETIQFISSFFDREHWADGLCAMCRYMQKNKRFYINALNTPGQNSFQEYLTQFSRELVRSMAEGLLDGIKIEESELEFIADFYSFAVVGLILKWARRGMVDEPTDFVNHVRELVDRSIQGELLKYGKQ